MANLKILLLSQSPQIGAISRSWLPQGEDTDIKKSLNPLKSGQSLVLKQIVDNIPKEQCLNPLKSGQSLVRPADFSDF